MSAPVVLADGEVYRWVDKDGNVHYSDKAPVDCVPERIETDPAPSTEDVERAQARQKKLISEFEHEQGRSPGNGGGYEGPPLPDNTVSEYLETEGIGWAFDFEGKKVPAQYTLMLKPRPALPAGAYLETYFIDPATGKSSIIAGEKCNGNETIYIESPVLPFLTCGYYKATVLVFRHETSLRPLGAHVQWALSSLDTREITTAEQLVEAAVNPGSTCQ